MRIAALLLWLAFPLGGYAAYLAYGSPYLIWSYSFQSTGSSYDPFADRYYTRCTYVGWGFVTVSKPARGGKCPWVRFLDAEAG